MRVLAIDPGNEQSAYVLFVDGVVLEKGIVPNAQMLDILTDPEVSAEDECAIEMVASFGMAVGKEVFETVYWIGRFAERWEASAGRPAHRVYRMAVKMHLCHAANAKDGNIRAALIDRFGPGKEKAIGKKATPGPLFGVSADVWSALAIAVTFADTHASQEAARG